MESGQNAYMAWARPASSRAAGSIFGRALSSRTIPFNPPASVFVSRACNELNLALGLAELEASCDVHWEAAACIERQRRAESAVVARAWHLPVHENLRRHRRVRDEPVRTVLRLERQRARPIDADGLGDDPPDRVRRLRLRDDKVLRSGLVGGERDARRGVIGRTVEALRACAVGSAGRITALDRKRHVQQGCLLCFSVHAPRNGIS
eukprot:4714997-Pleurochrysis_carterae.AAC.4